MFEKTLILGSAQWGWNIEAPQAWRLLDAWLKAGLKMVDAATNYPINRIASDFRKSEQILTEYLRSNRDAGIQVAMKIGSLDNMRGPEVNLEPSFIRMIGEEYARLLGTHMSCLMLHWDNRDDTEAIQASLETLTDFCRMMQWQPGISGVAHPDRYATVLSGLKAQVNIELKHNLLHTDLPRYAPLLQQGHRIWAYGLNAGGLKLDDAYREDSTLLKRGGPTDKGLALTTRLREYLPRWNRTDRPPITDMHQLGLLYAALHPAIDGILLGVSSEEQLQHTLTFYQNLRDFDYSDVFEALRHFSQ